MILCVQYHDTVCGVLFRNYCRWFVLPSRSLGGCCPGCRAFIDVALDFCTLNRCRPRFLLMSCRWLLDDVICPPCPWRVHIAPPGVDGWILNLKLLYKTESKSIAPLGMCNSRCHVWHWLSWHNNDVSYFNIPLHTYAISFSSDMCWSAPFDFNTATKFWVLVILLSG